MFGGFPGQNYFLKGELVLCSRNSYSYHWLPAHSIACPDVAMGFSLSKTSYFWKSVKHIKKVQCGLLQMKTYQGSIWLIKISDFKLTTNRTNHLRILSNSLLNMFACQDVSKLVKNFVAPLMLELLFLSELGFMMGGWQISPKPEFTPEIPVLDFLAEPVDLLWLFRDTCLAYVFGLAMYW